VKLSDAVCTVIGRACFSSITVIYIVLGAVPPVQRPPVAKPQGSLLGGPPGMMPGAPMAPPMGGPPVGPMMGMPAPMGMMPPGLSCFLCQLTVLQYIVASLHRCGSIKDWFCIVCQ